MLDFSRTWLPFIYLYGVGGIAFVIGTILIIKTNALTYHRRVIRIGLSYFYLDSFTTQVFMQLLF